MTIEKKKRTEEEIRAINNRIVACMMNEEKSTYDPEVQIPANVHHNIITKREYNIEESNKTNRKRREKRPSVLEQDILLGNYKEAEERIQKQHYTSLTKIAQHDYLDFDDRTAKKIIQNMLTMIGCKENMIPTVLVNETIDCMLEWKEHAKTLYKYNKGKMLPLDMTQNEMSCTYATYILVKKIILINAANKEEYEANIAALDQKLNPVYAAIRVLHTLE